MTPFNCIAGDFVLVVPACRTGVMFCVYQGNRGENEASAKRKLRARGGSRLPRFGLCSPA